MSKRDDGGPAFPTAWESIHGGTGMTIRDYFLGAGAGIAGWWFESGVNHGPREVLLGSLKYVKWRTA